MTGIYLALYAIGTITSAILTAFYLWVDQDNPDNPEDPTSRSWEEAKQEQKRKDYCPTPTRPSPARDPYW